MKLHQAISCNVITEFMFHNTHIVCDLTSSGQERSMPERWTLVHVTHGNCYGQHRSYASIILQYMQIVVSVGLVL